MIEVGIKECTKKGMDVITIEMAVPGGHGMEVLQQFKTEKKKILRNYGELLYKTALEECSSVQQ